MKQPKVPFLCVLARPDSERRINDHHDQFVPLLLLLDGDGVIKFVTALDVEDSEEVVSSALNCLISKGHLDQDIQREKETEVQKKSRRELEREYESNSDDDEDAMNGQEPEPKPTAQETERWYALARLDTDLTPERAFCTCLRPLPPTKPSGLKHTTIVRRLAVLLRVPQDRKGSYDELSCPLE